MVTTMRKLLDLLLMIAVYPAALLLGFIRKQGVHNLPNSKRALLSAGVFPIRDHYYEPRFLPGALNRPIGYLSGVKRDEATINRFLKRLTYAGELLTGIGVEINNPAFGPGDADVWYQVIRALKPKRIMEIGGGYSSLVAAAAIKRNNKDTPYQCNHLVIDPFLPKLPIANIMLPTSPVERIPVSFFRALRRGDILFIDSTHMIRPDGDVLFEYLALLPTLAPGVLVHIHDIFTPDDYPKDWREDRVLFWNEQYLLEAFLTQNDQWEIVADLHHLFKTRREQIIKLAPSLQITSNPASFYIRRK